MFSGDKAQDAGTVSRLTAVISPGRPWSTSTGSRGCAGGASGRGYEAQVLAISLRSLFGKLLVGGQLGAEGITVACASLNAKTPYRAGTVQGGLRETMSTSDQLRAAPPRRSRWRTWGVAAGLTILAAVFALFVWPQGEDDGGGSGPLNAIAAAAEQTQTQPGGRALMRARVTPADPSEAFTMTGEIVYNDEGEVGTIEFPSPETGEMVEMELILVGTMMYMRSDSFGSLPDDRSWIGLDVSFGGELELPASTGADVKGELEMLESISGVRKLGKAEVRGVLTTRYGGVVSVPEQVANLQEKGAERVASWIEKNGSPQRVEVWIDGDKMVRRMRLVGSKPSEHGDGMTTTDLRMDFFDFGVVPDIEIPAEGEVFDTTSMAEDELDSSAG